MAKAETLMPDLSLRAVSHSIVCTKRFRILDLRAQEHPPCIIHCAVLVRTCFVLLRAPLSFVSAHASTMSTACKFTYPFLLFPLLPHGQVV